MWWCFITFFILRRKHVRVTCHSLMTTDLVTKAQCKLVQGNALKICSSSKDYKCVVRKANSSFSLFRQSKMAKRPSFGGYEEERFEHEVDSKLLCPICSNVLKDPVQCQNEHYFCRSCINYL